MLRVNVLVGDTVVEIDSVSEIIMLVETVLVGRLWVAVALPEEDAVRGRDFVEVGTLVILRETVVVMLVPELENVGVGVGGGVTVSEILEEGVGGGVTVIETELERDPLDVAVGGGVMVKEVVLVGPGVKVPLKLRLTDCVNVRVCGREVVFDILAEALNVPKDCERD